MNFNDFLDSPDLANTLSQKAGSVNRCWVGWGVRRHRPRDDCFISLLRDWYGQLR